MIMQNFASMGVVTVLWFAIAFSLCFGESGGNFIGSPATFGGFNNVGALPLSHGAYSHTEGNAIVAGVPGIAFAGYRTEPARRNPSARSPSTTMYT